MKTRLFVILADQQLVAAVRWYFRSLYRRQAGPGAEPFYTDAAQVGAFAAASDSIRAGDDDSIFRLFIALSMYQALRDEVIWRQQRSIARSQARVVADLAFVGRKVSRHRCPALRSADALNRDCDVAKTRGVVDCERFPGLQCHVKDATSIFNRMGDISKLPSSAWLILWKDGR